MPLATGTASGEDVIRIAHTSRQTLIGRVRTCRSLSATEWTTILISFGTIMLGTGFSIFRFATLSSDSPDIVFSFLVFLNLCFAAFYIFHGIFQEQPFEMFTFSLSIFLVWMLIIANYLSDLAIQIKLIRLVVSSVLTLPNILIVLYVGWGYFVSGNLIFKTVGGDMKYQKYCRQLFFTYSLLAFDVQATLSCLILVMQRGFTNVTIDHVIVMVFGLIYSAVWISTGYVAMRTENLRLTYLFGVASAVQPLLVIFLVMQTIGVTNVDTKYSVLSVAVYVSGTSLLLAHFSLLAMVVIVSQNYKKGLIQKVYGVPASSAVPLRVEEEESSLHNSSDPLLTPTQGVINYDTITNSP